jgi:Putative esterase
MRTACSFLALFPILAIARTSTCRSTVTGDLTIVSFPNKTFGTTGFLSIWLPPGYTSTANASRRYPVLYMLDGQILFDDCRGGVPEWHIDETLTRLIQAGSIEPLIVVGIDAGQRIHEFLPYKDSVFSPASPEPAGRQFPRFPGKRGGTFRCRQVSHREGTAGHRRVVLWRRRCFVRFASTAGSFYSGIAGEPFFGRGQRTIASRYGAPLQGSRPSALAKSYPFVLG